MKKTYPINLVPNPLQVLRKAGYSPTVDPVTHEESFMIRITGDLYPRFHLYVERRGEEVTFSLHLDQKKGSYGNGPAHNGEYDGPTIEKEMERIDGWARWCYKDAQLHKN